MKTLGKKNLIKNFAFSFLAQAISLLVSFVVNLVVPKFISEYQYAYWQMYVLYVGYVGVLHFGLLDGLLLRYSQYDYEELDKKLVRSQFAFLMTVTTVIAAVGIITAMLALGESYRLILIFVAVGVLSKNIVTYTSYLFQITNRIKKYAIVAISQRAFFGVATVVLLAAGVKDFYWFCIADLVGDLFAIALGFAFNRDLYLGSLISFRDTIREAGSNIGAGMLLLIANWSSMLLVGGAKMMVQWRWDELVFGQVSFSFSITNLFLSFVSAVSVVLFPSLKRMEPEKLPGLYKNLREAISLVLFFAMIFYFPGCWILKKWLPAYEASLQYLCILLPLIIFSSKVGLLTDNYLKAYRKEKQMLIVNLICVALAFGLFAFSAYVLNNMTVLLVSVVFVIMLRSVISEIIVMKTIKIKIVADFIIEIVMTVVFIVFAKLLPLWIGCGAYTAALLVYFAIKHKTIKNFFTGLRRKRQ